MTLGIGSYTLPWSVGIGDRRPPQPLTPEDLLNLAIERGLRTVQYCENLPLVGLPDERLADLDRRAKAHGVQLDLGLRGLDAAAVEAHARCAHELGSRVLRLVIDSPGDEPSPREAIERLHPMVDRCGEWDVTLAIENHDRFASETLRRIVDALGPNCGVTLDTANSLGSLEGPDETLAILWPYTRCLHIKDVSARREDHFLGFRIFGTAAGHGQVNIPATLEKLRRHDERLPVVLEHWPAWVGTIDATLEAERVMFETSLQYLSHFFAWDAWTPDREPEPEPEPEEGDRPGEE